MKRPQPVNYFKTYDFDREKIVSDSDSRTVPRRLSYLEDVRLQRGLEHERQLDDLADRLAESELTDSQQLRQWQRESDLLERSGIIPALD